jgi:hypothetical protein
MGNIEIAQMLYNDGLPVDCAWFAWCENEAVMTEPHPILGDVPICGRCSDKLARLKESTT